MDDDQEAQSVPEHTSGGIPWGQDKAAWVLTDPLTRMRDGVCLPAPSGAKKYLHAAIDGFGPRHSFCGSGR